MSRRLQGFLPIVLLALAMQIVAPIAACWAAGIAIADPLQSAGICHSDATTGSGDQDREQHAHDGLCAICVAHAGTAVDAPRPVALVVLLRQFRPILWADKELTRVASRIGSNTQARAPPRFA
ncbi:DUF2946 domain-containing protein [Bradyrhizobium sp. 31Argb]|uniref:DUF2946 domain-containing protein n=1 Tax=unclassified Bradyrhizobium TaxID=2631580 RepID=UPI00102EA2AE|nr:MULTISPECIES: DUF2946 domain-containing protein [unclassified Bradyrhizobium]MDI4235648.1 DUF2946 domain-containing protein [Bradyrhizobium sp. Arg237L]TAI65322.1 hypothetical protein CWO89_14240 [Bradyrhizobium sp. Leo170]